MSDAAAPEEDAPKKPSKLPLIIGLVLVLALFLLGMVLMPVFLPLLFLFGQGFGLVQRGYPLLLGWALNQRLLVIGGVLAALLFCWYKLLPTLGTELIPQVYQAEFNLDISLPVGTPLDKTAEVVRQIRIQAPNTTIEILTPDFLRKDGAANIEGFLVVARKAGSVTVLPEAIAAEVEETAGTKPGEGATRH